MSKKSKEPEIRAARKNLEPEIVAKRPTKTFTEILAEPKVEKSLEIPLVPNTSAVITGMDYTKPIPGTEVTVKVAKVEQGNTNPVIKMADPQPILRGVDDHPKTAPLRNVKMGGIIEVSEPKPQSPLDFLRFPLGLLDFDNAGILFKNADAPNNKKLIEQFTLLQNLGYKATLGIVDNNYAYFQFDKV